MSEAPLQAASRLDDFLRSGRIHSAYLLSGAGEAPRQAAERFARGLVCTGPEAGDRPCERCDGCTKSRRDPDAKIRIDTRGESANYYVHIGDHSDLYWVEMDPSRTRVIVPQIHALQKRLSLRSTEGGRRVAVIADAEWLNKEAQSALLRLLEEPPPQTSILLAASRASALIATIRSRCVRVPFPAAVRPTLRGPEAKEEIAEYVQRLDGIAGLGPAGLLQWAEEFRGGRAVAADKLDAFLAVGAEWLRERVHARVGDVPTPSVDRELDAFHTLSEARRDMAVRNANPQLVAERSLIAIRQVFS